MDYAEARTAWLDWVRGTLQGPKGGPDEELPRSPFECYCSGILMPATADAEPAQGEPADALPDGTDGDLPADEPGSDEENPATIAKRRAGVLPTASVGMSFLLTPDCRLEVLVSGATYEYARGSRGATGGQPPRCST